MKNNIASKVVETDWTKLVAFVAIVQLILSWLKDAPIPEQYKPWLNSISTLLVQLVGFFLHQKKSPEEIPTEAETVALVVAPEPPPDPNAAEIAALNERLQVLTKGKTP